MLQRPCI